MLDFRGSFATTPWSVISRASSLQITEAQLALSTLCELYWSPIYAFSRRQGNDVHEAQDLTQAFFAHLLEKNAIESVDPHKGRFRTFLLMAFEHFCATRYKRDHRLKRGGHKKIKSLNFARGEELYSQEPFHSETPERIFNRRWVRSQIERVLSQLRLSYEDSNTLEIFDALKSQLTEDEQTPRAALAHRLGMSPTAVKVSLHRMRKKFFTMLQNEIATTVNDSAEFRSELEFFLTLM